MHDNICDNPLDMSNQKYTRPPRQRPASVCIVMGGSEMDRGSGPYPLPGKSQVAMGFLRNTGTDSP